MRALLQIVSRERLQSGRFIFPCLALLPFLLLICPRLFAKGESPIVGRIEGSDVVVKTATGEGVEVDAGPTVVATGSDVIVRSGSALLLLDGGGQISICGPAHFTLLKSAGNVTLALDYGLIHPSLDMPADLTIYTPMIVATPVAIAGDQRDTTVGLNQNGSMCIFTVRGAMRIEQQLTGQSLLVPQGGNINLVGGQIESLRPDPSSCVCTFDRTSIEKQRASPPVSSPAPQISTLDHPRETPIERPEATPPPAAPDQEPVYTVLMPAISFNANSPSPPPDPSPETILLVREERLRPSAVFHGHVDPAPVEAENLPAPASPPPKAQAAPAANSRAPQPKRGVLERMRNLFLKMTGQTP